MIIAKPEIRPTRGAAQPLILNDRGMRKQLLGFPLVFLAIVRPRPNAFIVKNLALSIASAATGAIPLVLGTLGLGT